jgi:hypothetical protein
MVKPFLTDGVLSEASYKKTIKQIHTTVVTECKRKLVNKVLGTAPSDIDLSESSLPQISRTTLSQLRSSYSKDLRTYQARIGTSPDDICRNSPHITKHIFECPDAPTDLNVCALWNSPCGAADFLRSLPSLSHLPVNPLSHVLPLSHLLGELGAP